MSHVTEKCEQNHACYYRGGAIDERNHYWRLDDLLPFSSVAAVHNERTHSKSGREEDLARCSDPDVDIEKCTPLWNKKESKSDTDAVKSTSLDQKHEK